MIQRMCASERVLGACSYEVHIVLLVADRCFVCISITVQVPLIICRSACHVMGSDAKDRI